MKLKLIQVIALIAVISLTALLFSFFSTNNNPTAKPQPPLDSTVAELQPKSASVISLQSSSSLNSPFGTGAPAQPRSIEERARYRLEKMRKSGYATPEIYYSMSLEKLLQLASKHDLFAYIQLGEQYTSEAKDLESEPGYDFKDDPRLIGAQFFEKAVSEGDVHISSVLAQTYFDAGLPLQARKWQIVAQMFGDDSSNDALGALSSLSQDEEKSAQTDATLQYYRSLKTVPHSND